VDIGKARRRVILKTSSMGIIKSVSGPAAKAIQADMKNPNINMDVIKRSSELAATISIRKSSK